MTGRVRYIYRNHEIHLSGYSELRSSFIEQPRLLREILSKRVIRGTAVEFPKSQLNDFVIDSRSKTIHPQRRPNSQNIPILIPALLLLRLQHIRLGFFHMTQQVVRSGV